MEDELFRTVATITLTRLRPCNKMTALFNGLNLSGQEPGDPQIGEGPARGNDGTEGRNHYQELVERE